MESDRPWTTSVSELVSIFRNAMLALIPIASEARMAWREPDNYDDWDSIAQSLFYSFVVSSIENADEWKDFYEIPAYDVRHGSYAQKSFLSVATDPARLAFVCFETEISPFDTAMFVQLDVSGKVLELERRPVDQVHFVLSGRSKDSIIVIDRVNVNI